VGYRTRLAALAAERRSVRQHSEPRDPVLECEASRAFPRGWELPPVGV
jgi:hypothetical protein